MSKSDYERYLYEFPSVFNDNRQLEMTRLKNFSEAKTYGTIGVSLPNKPTDKEGLIWLLIATEVGYHEVFYRTMHHSYKAFRGSQLIMNAKESITELFLKPNRLSWETKIERELESIIYYDSEEDYFRDEFMDNLTFLDYYNANWEQVVENTNKIPMMSHLLRLIIDNTDDNLKILNYGKFKSIFY